MMFYGGGSQRITSNKNNLDTLPVRDHCCLTIVEVVLGMAQGVDYDRKVRIIHVYRVNWT